MKESDLALSLRGKPPAGIAEVAQRLIAGDQRGLYKLSLDERQLLIDVIGRVRSQRKLTEDQVAELNRVVRHFEQHVIARSVK